MTPAKLADELETYADIFRVTGVIASAGLWIGGYHVGRVQDTAGWAFNAWVLTAWGAAVAVLVVAFWLALLARVLAHVLRHPMAGAPPR